MGGDDSVGYEYGSCDKVVIGVRYLFGKLRFIWPMMYIYRLVDDAVKVR